MSTVAQVIAQLQEFPPDLPLGVEGWYGEFYDIDVEDFWLGKSMRELPWPLYRGYTEEFVCVRLMVPDIGEAPE